MRLYILSTNWRKRGDEYFLTFTVRNKRKFYGRTHHYGEYPSIIYRNEISTNGFGNLKSILIPQSETDVALINYDNDINDYGFWIKMKCNTLIKIIESFIIQEKLEFISDNFENMSIYKKRKSDNMDQELSTCMQLMNITKKKRILHNTQMIIDDPYMADTET